jgi:hypothetical protein
METLVQSALNEVLKNHPSLKCVLLSTTTGAPLFHSGLIFEDELARTSTAGMQAAAATQVLYSLCHSLNCLTGQSTCR